MVNCDTRYAGVRLNCWLLRRELRSCDWQIQETPFIMYNNTVPHASSLILNQLCRLKVKSFALFSPFCWTVGCLRLPVKCPDITYFSHLHPLKQFKLTVLLDVIRYQFYFWFSGSLSVMRWTCCQSKEVRIYEGVSEIILPINEAFHRNTVAAAASEHIMMVVVYVSPASCFENQYFC